MTIADRHAERHQTTHLFDGVSKLDVVYVLLVVFAYWAMALVYAYILRPFLWWFIQGGHLHVTDDNMLLREGIQRPGLERMQVIAGAALFLGTALFAGGAYYFWPKTLGLLFLVLAAIAGLYYGIHTGRYLQKHHKKNDPLDAWG
jgi:hypothetical protein